MKRIVLFLATNLAVVLVMSVVLSLLGVNRYLTANGLKRGTLLVYSIEVGFTGAIMSLRRSKQKKGFAISACSTTTST